MKPNLSITRNAPAILLLLTLALPGTMSGQPDASRAAARPAPGWVRDGVIYEIFPRQFSPEGNFNGITAKLDELKDLGVNV
ncbi:MAG TPA: alpha-amylase, partial [Verrucomicrobiota bacterium]|nr:alpha-amylase [Verrucomicrobiota bacterium]